MSTAGKAIADWTSFDAEDTRSHFSIARDDGAMESTLTVKGIRCGSCSLLIERTLTAHSGVREVTVNVAAGTVRVLWAPAQVKFSSLLRDIEAAGFEPAPMPGTGDGNRAAMERRAAILRIGVAGIGAMQVMMYAVALYAGAFQGMQPAHEQFLRLVSLLVATPVVVYAGRPFFVSAWNSLRARHAGMDVPVALAIATAFIASVWTTLFAADGLQHEVYFDSAVMFVFLLSLGRYLESAARHKTAGTSQALAAMVPATASRVNADGSVTSVPVVSLRPGDHIVAAAGEPIAADGVVLRGSSHVNEAMLTGESAALPRSLGDAVVGGSINVANPLTIRVTQTTGDSVLSNIARLIDRALTQKPAQVSLADRIASYFIVGVLAAASATFFYWYGRKPELAFPAALSVLVVTCPCALSLATPAALTAAIGRLARSGVLTANSDAIDRLARITHVVFDKTGTLTSGTVEVTAVRTFAHTSRLDALAVTAALEQGVTHPVGRCLEQAASAALGDAPRPVAANLINHPGAGVEATIDGTTYRIGRPDFVASLYGSEPPDGDVLLGSAGGVVAAFDLDDSLREGARSTIDALKAEGLVVCIASGDSPQRVSQIADALGIETTWSRLSPADKLERIRQLQSEGATVGVVGDGVNDGPVLAGADVSLAMADGTALAQASADLVLVSNRLEALTEAIDVARRCRRIIRQNIVWAIAYNSLALPAAAAAMLAPWMAAAGMSLSSVAVVLNAVRLNRGTRR